MTSERGSLDEVGHIQGHLLHRGVVEGLDIPESSLVVLGYHVDSHAFPAKTASSANPTDNKTTMRWVPEDAI